MKIRRYNDSNYDSWEAFVKSSNNGTLFHSRQFLNYHPENRFQDYSLMLYKKDQLQSVFPAVSVLEKNKRSVPALISYKNKKYDIRIRLKMSNV